jgi:HSP20 family protein
MFLVPVSRESRQLSRLFDDAFERFFGPVAATEANGARSPALDVAESDRSYTVKLEMPGVAKEDIKVAIEGRQVSVQAHSERAEERKEGDRVVYRERSASSYARSFTLPMDVDQADSNAKLENGVLTLTLPKRAARTAASIAVN